MMVVWNNSRDFKKIINCINTKNLLDGLKLDMRFISANKDMCLKCKTSN